MIAITDITLKKWACNYIIIRVPNVSNKGHCVRVFRDFLEAEPQSLTKLGT